MASMRGAGPIEELKSCATATMMRAVTPAPNASPKIPITSGREDHDHEEERERAREDPTRNVLVEPAHLLRVLPRVEARDDRGEDAGEGEAYDRQEGCRPGCGVEDADRGTSGEDAEDQDRREVVEVLGTLRDAHGDGDAEESFCLEPGLRPAVEEVGEELPEVVEPEETGEEHRERVGGYDAENLGPEHVTHADEDQEQPWAY